MRGPVIGTVGVEPDQGVERRDRDGLGVGVGHRRSGCGAVLPDDPSSVGVGRRVERVAPPLLAQPAGERPRPAADEPVARGQGTFQPAGGRRAGCGQLLGEGLVTGGVEQHEEPRGRVGGAEVAQRAVAHRPAQLDQPVGGDRPVLVQDPARLLLGLRVLVPALPGGERAQGGGRHLGLVREHLESGDQGVAAEQGVEPAGVGGVDRRGGGVHPSVG